MREFRTSRGGIRNVFRLLCRSVVILLMLPVTLMAEVCSDSSTAGELTQQGQAHFYRTEWSQAQTCYHALQEKMPDDPTGYFLDSMIPFWEYYFVERDPELADRFFEASQKAITRAERILVAHPDHPGAIAMLSGLYGYRSMVASEEGEIREAFRSGRRGYDYTQRLMEMEQRTPEMLIGRGIYHYMAGSVPRSLRWLARLFGLDGQKQTGVDYLEEAVRGDSFSRLDARLILSVIYRREDLLESALYHLNELLSEYDENRIFLLMKADLLQESGDLEAAGTIYETLTREEDARWERLSARAREEHEELLRDRS